MSMKNYLTTLLICLSVVGVKAQLPDGSVGPNFTVTDIEGNSHTLYDILDSGYTVVMDLNATWCGPCWSYHQAGHLETLWEEHGPAGWPGVSANTTDDVFVFMIESSSNTGLADLQGETSNSYGDWITGTHFPIVNEETVASSYELAYYPTVFTVCPNRIVTESGAISADAHYSVIGECVNAQNGKNLATFDYTGEKTTCGTNVDVKARFQNMGTDNVTAFTAEVFDGSNSIATQQYSGNSISTYGFVELDFGTVQIDGPTSLEIKITSEDVLQSDNSLNQNIVLAKEGSGNMTLQITTDNFGNQVSWEIKDLNGTTVESGGPYSNSSNTTEYDPQPQDDQSISLESDGCYFFEVYDSQNNGMYNYPTHDDGPSFFRLLSGSQNTTIVEIFGDEYKASLKRKFLYKKVSAIKENSIVKNSIYPNPTNGLSTLEVNMNEKINNVALNVFNILGEMVISKSVNLNVGANAIPLKLEHLEAGIYTVELLSPSLNISQKLIKID